MDGWRRFAPRRAALRVERQKTTIAQNESYFDAMRNRLEDAAVRQIQRWWRGARVRLRNYRWRVVGKLQKHWRLRAALSAARLRKRRAKLT